MALALSGEQSIVWHKVIKSSSTCITMGAALTLGDWLFAGILGGSSQVALGLEWEMMEIFCSRRIIRWGRPYCMFLFQLSGLCPVHNFFSGFFFQNLNQEAKEVLPHLELFSHAHLSNTCDFRSWILEDQVSIRDILFYDI